MVGTKPRASHHQSPGGERHGQRKLETLPAGTKPKTLHHRPPGGERYGQRKHLMIFLEWMREGHHLSDEHCNCFKGNVGETSERQGFSEHIDTILNWQELPGKIYLLLEVLILDATHTLWTSRLTDAVLDTHPKKQQEHLPDFTRNSKHVPQNEVKTTESCDFVVLGPSRPCKSVKVERKHKHIIMTLEVYKRILLKQGKQNPTIFVTLTCSIFLLKQGHFNIISITGELGKHSPHCCIFFFFKHDKILRLRGGGGELNMNPMNLLCMVHPLMLFLNKVCSTRDVLPQLFLRKHGGYFHQWKAQQSMTHLLYGRQSLALSVDSLQRL